MNPLIVPVIMAGWTIIKDIYKMVKEQEKGEKGKQKKARRQARISKAMQRALRDNSNKE